MKQIERFDCNLYQRSREAIAHGALTNSKRPESFVKGIYPTHLASGNGCWVKDVNGNSYIDFICALGTNLLGYNNPDINDAVTRQLRKGSLLSLGTELEVEAAERVKEFFPFVERVRFLKTGSEACMAAVRIARAAAKREGVTISEGYHGQSDDFVSMTPPANGVPSRPWMLSDVRNIDLAHTVIVEPVELDCSTNRIDFLGMLRHETKRQKVTLIFDEVITGLRFPNYSVASEYSVTPDLICLGKALGGGLPLSVVAGRADLMDQDYFVSSTFAGDTLALAACIKTFELLRSKFSIDRLWGQGLEFLEKFNAIWPEGIQLKGYPTRGRFVGGSLNLALFMQEACRAGILVGPSFFLCFPHLEILDQVLSSFTDILRRIERGEVELKGEMPETPYAQKVRETEKETDEYV